MTVVKIRPFKLRINVSRVAVVAAVVVVVVVVEQRDSHSGHP
jgi:hypothetical protein